MTGAGFRILLVDDEKHFADTLAARLEMRGFEVRAVYSGAEALAAVALPTELVVLDLRMPGMDGLEVLRALKKSHPLIRVIMLTGHIDDQEERAAYEAGAQRVLRKPLRMDELLDCIR
ncbi:MAG: response regulator [Deltaproteobacteria bacterium]|jgi:CheY-like chemotaxis protein|nr:response regulator [Deltaproteobacteria bacterium]